MNNAISNINKHTYMPALASPFSSSLLYKRKHPKVSTCLHSTPGKNQSFFSSSQIPYTISHLIFPLMSLQLPFILLKYTTIYLIVHASKTPSLSCVQILTCFYALILLNRREIEKQYLHCLVSIPF